MVFYSSKKAFSLPKEGFGNSIILAGKTHFGR